MAVDDERFEEACHRTLRSGQVRSVQVRCRGVLTHPPTHTHTHDSLPLKCLGGWTAVLLPTPTPTILILTLTLSLALTLPHPHPHPRWLDRCIAANANPERQNLFGIVQGGLDVRPGGLREVNLKGMVRRDLPGYAIGGLAGGETCVCVCVGGGRVED